MLLLSSWVKFTGYCLFNLMIASVVCYFIVESQNNSNGYYNNLKVIVLIAFVFALFEKSKKE